MNPLRRLTISPPADAAAQYPFSVPAVRDTSVLDFATPVTFFVGECAPLPGATIWSFDEKPPRAIAYDEAEHVRVTRDFLNAPERFLRHL